MLVIIHIRNSSLLSKTPKICTTHTHTHTHTHTGSIPDRGNHGIFSLSHLIQTGSGALTPGVKRPGCEADHSPPSSAEVPRLIMCGAIPPLYNTSSWHGA
jgi:hypothetical protein